MRHAFTMMELIFVIVILGILVAFAIPRLALTREDANFVQILANTKQLMSDVMMYNASQGGISNDIKDMTNVPNVSFSGSVNLNNATYPQYLIFKANDCVLKFGFVNDAGGHVVVRLDPSVTINDCKVLERNNEFVSLKNGEYPVGSKAVF